MRVRSNTVSVQDLLRRVMRYRGLALGCLPLGLAGIDASASRQQRFDRTKPTGAGSGHQQSLAARKRAVTSLATATDEVRQCWPVSISNAFFGLPGSPKPP